MYLSLKPLSRLLAPCLLLFASLFAVDKIELINHAHLGLLENTPYFIVILAIVIAYYFNRARILATAVLLAVGYWLIQQHLQAPLNETTTLTVYSFVSLLSPLGLTAILLLPERGIWNGWGLTTITVPLLLLWAGWLLVDMFDYQQLLAGSALFAIKTYPGYVLSPAAALGFLPPLLAALILLFWKDSETDAALLGTAALMFTTLCFFDRPYISAFMYGSAGIVLLIGLLRNSFDMAYRDDLTGLLGRRAMNEQLHNLRNRYSIAMLDIDHFKKFNDKHGHDVGDQVLKLVARHIAKIGGGGTPYRYGGEEFCVLFPHKDSEPCTPHLEALRTSIANHAIALRNKKTRPKSTQEGQKQRGNKGSNTTVKVTISIGIAEAGNSLKEPVQVLKEADKALYRAKKQGRNCLAA